MRFTPHPGTCVCTYVSPAPAVLVPRAITIRYRTAHTAGGRHPAPRPVSSSAVPSRAHANPEALGVGGRGLGARRRRGDKICSRQSSRGRPCPCQVFAVCAYPRLRASSSWWRPEIGAPRRPADRAGQGPQASEFALPVSGCWSAGVRYRVVTALYSRAGDATTRQTRQRGRAMVVTATMMMMTMVMPNASTVDYY
ncbi:hypothetical protein BC834DRAFT_701537 [Gloeopeniophorella convolvens]|nr:hypothetical protein BC834DRAFT_701537 [Gloeopeniophorella convolvens]